ncbi:5-methyltetrahydropteroyltriglutamate--homocysteine S-methyltransferase [Cyclobacterium qasimii]|uniref:5-methyltetrahydropteroyltriglutamate--homocysteine methyltransferase n=1 Tax=Cyclobacterium qasimii TaxID=1350429 RepID=A0A512CIA9_9BACT|nr:5-methyltetrahydropteroyltriglutamate--homocysteine S-methyltransferase [Cyclobacterium qasimii]GEO23957.1 5-methyltetrahydropteroyltriglutamate--homocysteine methyltransferase [Cyclobacterium qasimii]
MQTHILGYPRIGSKRELKKACEQYWSGKISSEELAEAGRAIRFQNWKTQAAIGIDLIPVNDFSFYDQVLDMSLMVGAIPERYLPLLENPNISPLDHYFAMARGYQKDGLDITAMEMTKWFDTNYHYLVPEFTEKQGFNYHSTKVVDEFKEAKRKGINAKPVLIGPVTYLLLGKEKTSGFDKIDLIHNLLPVYLEILKDLETNGADWVQFDEPFLGLDLNNKEKEAFQFVYQSIRKAFPKLKILLATYFEGLNDNIKLALSLPICALHLDLVRNPAQLEEILLQIPEKLSLSLGLVDGRNIWKNDFNKSLEVISKVINSIGKERIMLAPSCSLLHVPYDLEAETQEGILLPEIKQWIAFAKQKLKEVVLLQELSLPNPHKDTLLELETNKAAIASRENSSLIHNETVKLRVASISPSDDKRDSRYASRKTLQQKLLKLPALPTTTIGSFPQTGEVRKWRSQFRKGFIDAKTYENLLKEATEKVIRKQEEIGLDVLVHGEYERNDMVEYFGEQLAGFTFSQFGWVQSYGSRCVKPPIIYGDVFRPAPMTVFWSSYAQSLTKKRVKGMLTGPVTILQWSFVRNDQPRSQTCRQIALAIRDEVTDLESAGIKIIQIDEPAIREGLPLRKSEWEAYLDWAVEAFRLTSSGVSDATQIHTHMCYSEFNDIMPSIAAMDADVITIECSRSQMELLDAFADFKYPNEIGPGIYDIHAPRVPTKSEMVQLIKKAQDVIPTAQLWVNPDCGLKTRQWDETEKALKLMVEAAKELRAMEKIS